MKKVSYSEQRVLQMLEHMKKAMPEIKRQIAVYEQNVRLGSHVKPVKISISPKNV